VSRNRATVKPEQKQAFKEGRKNADLAARYEIFGVAHAKLKAVLEIGLPECEPIDEVRQDLEELGKKAESLLEIIEGFLGEQKWTEASEALIMALRSWGSTPWEEKFEELEGKVKYRTEYKKAKGKNWVLLRQQSMFHLAMRYELGGKKDAAARTYKELRTLGAESRYGLWAKERLDEMQPDAE
jgi:hypothetical protein